MTTENMSTAEVPTTADKETSDTTIATTKEIEMSTISTENTTGGIFGTTGDTFTDEAPFTETSSGSGEAYTGEMSTSETFTTQVR